MKVREVINRVIGGNFKGLMVVPPGYDEPMKIEFLSKGLVWLMEKEQTQEAFVLIQATAEEYKEWEVWEGEGQIPILRDGDYVYVDGTMVGLSNMEKARVERVKEGDASPYPVVVSFSYNRKGQYRIDEIRAVVRED